MATRTLNKLDWEAYLNRVSKELGACLAEVEVAGLGIGDQVEAEWVTLTGASYRSEERRVGKECRSRWSPYH